MYYANLCPLILFDPLKPLLIKGHSRSAWFLPPLFFVIFVLQYLPAAISPAPKFKVTLLVIKRKPCNVNLACTFKDSWRYIQAIASMWDNNIGLEGSIKFFIGTESIRIETSHYINPILNAILRFCDCILRHDMCADFHGFGYCNSYCFDCSA